MFKSLKALLRLKELLHSAGPNSPGAVAHLQLYVILTKFLVMWSFSIKMFWKQWKFNITYCAVCNKEEKGRGEVQLYLKKGFQARLHNAQKTANMPKCLRCVFMQFKVQEYHLRIKLEIMDANSKIVCFSPTVINSSFKGISVFLWSQTTQ